MVVLSFFLFFAVLFAMWNPWMVHGAGSFLDMLVMLLGFVVYIIVMVVGWFHIPGASLIFRIAWVASLAWFVCVLTMTLVASSSLFSKDDKAPKLLKKFTTLLVLGASVIRPIATLLTFVAFAVSVVSAIGSLII